MTRLFRNVLVDIDGNATAQPALELAARLARNPGARMRVVDAAASRRPPEEVLIDEVQRGGHDLVVRAQERDLVGGTAVNAHLFRYCPCPVWAAGMAPLPAHPKVLAAVNPGADDREATELDAACIETALHLADSEGGSVTVLHAWRPFAEKKIAVYATDIEFETALESTRQRAEDDLARLVGLSPVRVELRRGLPETVVPEFAVAEGVDVVVIGVRTGKGIWQRLFGDTALRVLERAPCSVLAVKAEKRKDAYIALTQNQELTGKNT